MKQKIIFQNANINKIKDFFQQNKKRHVFGFLNQHDLYQASKELKFLKVLLENQNMNFIDGFIISFYLSISNFKKVSRMSGPFLTREILSNPELSQNKKHFFIGPEQKDIIKLKKKFPHLKKVQSYSPPFIKTINFSKKEIDKMSKLINKQNPDFVWVGVGSPKQNILSSALRAKTKAQYFMNVGAALDFLLEKKKQAPKIIRSIGIEWIFRLITDFQYSRKKVWRSFLGLSQLKKINLNDKNNFI